jgi:hypothetical protein
MKTINTLRKRNVLAEEGVDGFYKNQGTIK